MARRPDPPIVERTFQFGMRIVKLCDFFNERKGVGYHFSKQVFRSGTSVGANVEEAQAGQSKADFINKLSIAKEVRETRYWLRLAIVCEVPPKDRGDKLLDEAGQIMRILGAIIVSARKRDNEGRE